MKYIWHKFVRWVVLTVGKIHWASDPNTLLSELELQKIRSLLKDNYFVILTHRSNHLSTFFVCLINFILTGRWGYWAHSFMNLENEVENDSDFRIIEAIGDGVQVTPFSKAFDVQGVSLLKPKNMSIEYWTQVLDRARTELGKPYDTLFDLANDQSLSCVELVRTALMVEPNYDQNFSNFEKMISSRKNLTPQMFYECSDFEVIFEVRR